MSLGHWNDCFEHRSKQPKKDSVQLSITNCFEKQKKLQEKEHHTELQSEIDPLESSDNFDLDSNTAADLDEM